MSPHMRPQHILRIKGVLALCALEGSDPVRIMGLEMPFEMFWSRKLPSTDLTGVNDFLVLAQVFIFNMNTERGRSCVDHPTILPLTLVHSVFDTVSSGMSVTVDFCWELPPTVRAVKRQFRCVHGPDMNFELVGLVENFRALRA
jgi:hypothetical protein